MKPCTLLILAAVVMLRGVSAADPSQQPAPKAAVVVAYGYSTKTQGKTRAELHREALSDALKNAAIQAHTELQVEACTEKMRLKKQSARMISRGYVESSQLLEAAFLKDDPSIYRIRIRARIRPLPEPSTETPEATYSSDSFSSKSSAAELMQ